VFKVFVLHCLNCIPQLKSALLSVLKGNLMLQDQVKQLTAKVEELNKSNEQLVTTTQRLCAVVDQLLKENRQVTFIQTPKKKKKKKKLNVSFLNRKRIGRNSSPLQHMTNVGSIPAMSASSRFQLLS
jgi:hypothetical protein